MNSVPCSLLAAALIASAGTTIAQSSASNSSKMCNEETNEDYIIKHSNASGLYTYPSFSPPPTFGSLGAKTIPAGDWTWGTALGVTDEGRDQEFWIDTPNLKNVDPKDIPYELCNIEFDGLPRSTYGKGQDDNGDCLATLNQDCVDDLNKLAQTTATAQLGNDNAEDRCGAIQSQIISQPPDSCKSFLDGGNWGSAFGRGFFLPSTKEDNDTDTNFGNNICESLKDENTRQSFGFIRGNETFDQAQYDEDIYRVTPFLTVAMTRDAAAGSTLWSESRWICMRLGKIAAGSEVPPPFTQAATTTGKPSGPAVTPPPKNSAIGGKIVTLKVVASIGLMVVMLSQLF